MSDILARAGISLADVYDVRGSVAHVEELLSREVHLFHEMGGTIFSERASGVMNIMTTGAVLQNVNIGVQATGLPTTPMRILGILALVDTAARVDFLSVAAVDSIAGAETDYPIFTWDSAVDGVRDVRHLLAGAGPTNTIMLVPTLGGNYMPNLLLGSTAPAAVSGLTLRGRTTGFGAGDVTVDVVVYLAFADEQGVSSYGLPIPSW